MIAQRRIPHEKEAMFSVASSRPDAISVKMITLPRQRPKGSIIGSMSGEHLPEELVSRISLGSIFGALKSAARGMTPTRPST